MIPRPLRQVSGTGAFVLDESTTVVAPLALCGVASWLQSALRPATGLPLRDAAAVAGPAIVLGIDTDLAPEEFRLRVTPAGVSVVGGRTAGVFYGCQALLQLLPAEIFRRALVTGPAWTIDAVEIDDAPRFRWRGAMLDVARHFMPKHDLLRFIDLMAMHRLNVLHLHLTDDQGWRVEILRYPRLTEVGAWRRESQVGVAPDSPTDGRPHGGYYTQDDIHEIVGYAAERCVTVVPEIDSPGHVQAALAAYPELGVAGEQLEVKTQWGINPNVLNVEESTVDFFTGVLDEVMDLFPAMHIGIGGDECPREQWHADPRTQERLVELGLGSADELQGWFTRRMGAHLATRGRHLFGWDEILEGELPHGTTVAAWRGTTGAVSAARRGLDVVACPEDVVYLDYRQSERPDEPIPVSFAVSVEDAYAFEPVPPELSELEAQRVLGGQANMWTETADSTRVVDYLAFPRLCAIAEALWSSQERDFAEFEPRLHAHLQRLDALGVEYRRSGGPLPWQQRPGILGRPESRADRAAHIAEIVAAISLA